MQELLADGRSFGLAGAYEKLEGRVFLSLDPDDPGNARVVDLDKAPRRQDGQVEYAADLYILRPIDPRRGNGTAPVEVPNRGGKAMVRYFNRGATRSRDPVATADLGDGFLMRSGFSLIWLGWQYDVPPDPELLRLHPVRATAVESPLEGLVRADEVFAQRRLTFPLIGDGTLVPPDKLSFPRIPGLGAFPPPHQVHRVDYGPRFRSHGIVDLQPPRVGRAFPVLVPQVDGDGNELGGLRLPEIAVPLATYTTWNLRAPEIGAPHDMAGFVGAFLPLSLTRAERKASGDPRLSLEERYASCSEYLGRYTEAAIELVRQRYLLAEDLPEMIEHAEELWDHVVSEARESRPAAQSQ